MKSAEEIMNILEAYDLTGSFVGRRRTGREPGKHSATRHQGRPGIIGYRGSDCRILIVSQNPHDRGSRASPRSSVLICGNNSGVTNCSCRIIFRTGRHGTMPAMSLGSVMSEDAARSKGRWTGTVTNQVTTTPDSDRRSTTRSYSDFLPTCGNPTQLDGIRRSRYAW